MIKKPQKFAERKILLTKADGLVSYLLQLLLELKPNMNNNYHHLRVVFSLFSFLNGGTAPWIASTDVCLGPILFRWFPGADWGHLSILFSFFLVVLTISVEPRMLLWWSTSCLAIVLPTITVIFVPLPGTAELYSYSRLQRDLFYDVWKNVIWYYHDYHVTLQLFLTADARVCW